MRFYLVLFLCICWRGLECFFFPFSSREKTIEVTNRGSSDIALRVTERTFLAWLRTSLAFASIGTDPQFKLLYLTYRLIGLLLLLSQVLLLRSFSDLIHLSERATRLVRGDSFVVGFFS